jgi:hypothetical protein
MRDTKFRQMKKPFETIRKQGSEYIGHIYTVHIEDGRCDDLGDYPHRPKHYEPDTVSHVFDENGNDVTEWAVKEFGEDVLMDKRGVDLT